MQFLKNTPLFVFAVTILFGTPIVAVIYFVINNYESNIIVENKPVDSSHLNARLVALEVNRWMSLKNSWSLPWSRQSHAGITYNKLTNTLIVFGSNTHAGNWDNSIHEFDPIKEKWTTHLLPADHDSYRLDEYGRAIAGNIEISPWAMQTYDNIVYDPKSNFLFVTATPQHNPKVEEFNKAIQPLWVYDLNNMKWRIFESKSGSTPKIFNGAVEYDPKRDTIVAYANGIWELGPKRDEWVKVSSDNHHSKHYNMEYDSKHNEFVIFGKGNLKDVIWSYVPANQPLRTGTWKKQEPIGDIPSPANHYPVAFDPVNEVFLLLALNKNNMNSKETLSSASTYVFDLATSKFQKIPDSELLINEMNYMLTYDEQHKVFLIVTEKENQQPLVLAFKLDLKKLGTRTLRSSHHDPQ